MTARRTSHRHPRLHKLFASRRRRWGIGLGVLLIVALLIFGIQRFNADRAAQKPHFTTMRVATQPSFNLTGKIEPVQTQTLTVPSGKLQSLSVKDGDHVAQGQAILTMHNDNLQNNLAELQGQLNSGQDSSTAPDQQPSTAPVQQQLNNLSGQVNQTVVAPYSGYVSIDQSKQNQPVVTLYSDNLQFTGQVSEYDYDKLHQSTDLWVKALATNRTAKTQVSYLATIPSKNSGNNTRYKVTANINAEQFMAGQTAKAAVKQDGILIPKRAVRHGHVFVVDDDGHVRKTQVSGHAVNNSYVVTDGVMAGDRIVTNPTSKLKNHAKVD